MIKELSELTESDMYPFHMPGHKRQLFEDSCYFENADWLDMAYRHDITEIDGFDDLKNPKGLINDIETRLADLYSSQKAYLSVNGSTCCNLAAISALLPMNGLLMMDRGAHTSVYNAVFLGRHNTIFLERESLPGIGLTACISNDEIREKLKNAKKEGNIPNAILITSPTYEGFVADVDRAAETAHEYGLPLIVDGAHGAHFTADEKGNFFKVSLKADITIVSLHKTLPALTQVSAVLINSSIVKPEMIKKYINIFQTTSPSYILMASAERCVQVMQKCGLNLKEKLYKQLDLLYSESSHLGRLALTGPEYVGKHGIYAFDKSKMNIMDKRGHMSGQELYDIFRKEYHLQPEKAEKNTCLLMGSVMDTEEGFIRLRNAIREIDKR